jgi:hypothetical protein
MDTVYSLVWVVGGVGVDIQEVGEECSEDVVTKVVLMEMVAEMVNKGV